MSINYRVKKKKRRSSDNRITLVAQHKKKVDELDNLEKSIPSITKELNKIKKERDNLVLSSNGLGAIEAMKGKKIYVLNQRIKKLERKIKNIESNKTKDDYYAKTSHILFQYYDNIKAVSERHTKKLPDNVDAIENYA